jgi:microcystin degradation protein MlrC
MGDLTHVLARLLALDVESAVYAGVADAEAVGACLQAGVGAEVSIALGGKLDPHFGAPLPVRGRVIAAEANAMNKRAVLDVRGVKVVVTERRTPFHQLSQFRELGIEPLDHSIVALKIGYLVPELARAAPKTLLALSPGAVDQDIARLPFRRVQRPVYPIDPDMRWEAETGAPSQDG